MIHKFIQGSNSKRPTFVLFHGTGGSENDLVQIAQLIDPEASILALRGDVVENGMLRFFKRLGPNVFDYEDIAQRVEAYDVFIHRACEQYHLDRQDLIALGYSNGANLIAQIILKKELSFHYAILMHPMDIDPKKSIPILQDIEILITTGVNDPIVPKDSDTKLHKRLMTLGASVELLSFSQGHQLSNAEVQAVIKWYKKIIIDPESHRD
jgi:phospholipase/carboxylesterase